MSPPQSFRSFREADVQLWVACSSVSCVSNFKLWHQPRGCLILHNPHNSPTKLSTVTLVVHMRVIRYSTSGWRRTVQDRSFDYYVYCFLAICGAFRSRDHTGYDHTFQACTLLPTTQGEEPHECTVSHRH